MSRSDCEVAARDISAVFVSDTKPTKSKAILTISAILPCHCKHRNHESHVLAALLTLSRRHLHHSYPLLLDVTLSSRLILPPSVAIISPALMYRYTVIPG